MDFITFEAKGRSVSDPVEINTKTGKKGVKGAIAINKLIHKGGGQFETKTMFFEYEYWGIDLEEATAKLGKGFPVQVSGELKDERWISNTNEKRKSVLLKLKTARRTRDEN